MRHRDIDTARHFLYNQKVTIYYGRIAQSVEQLPFKEMAGGSNPSAPTSSTVDVRAFSLSALQSVLTFVGNMLIKRHRKYCLAGLCIIEKIQIVSLRRVKCGADR